MYLNTCSIYVDEQVRITSNTKVQQIFLKINLELCRKCGILIKKNIL